MMCLFFRCVKTDCFSIFNWQDFFRNCYVYFFLFLTFHVKKTWKEMIWFVVVCVVDCLHSRLSLLSVIDNNFRVTSKIWIVSCLSPQVLLWFLVILLTITILWFAIRLLIITILWFAIRLLTITTCILWLAIRLLTITILWFAISCWPSLFCGLWSYCC